MHVIIQLYNAIQTPEDASHITPVKLEIWDLHLQREDQSFLVQYSATQGLHSKGEYNGRANDTKNAENAYM